MDKEALLRVEKTLHLIKNKLLSNPELRKLLYYSSEEVKSSLEDLKEVTENAVSDNIYLQLIIDTDTKPPFNKRNFIALRLNNFSVFEGQADYTFNITIASEKHDWILCDKIRPLLIAQQVINELDNQKFELSNPIEIEQGIEQIINDDVTGYTLICSATDGIHDKT